MNDNQKCADYLLSKDLDRFMQEFKKKWQIYGCFKGRIKLKNTSVSERNALEGILGEKYQTEVVTIQVKAFVNALEHSTFQNLDLKEVLNLYFREPVYTFKESKESNQLSLNAYFSSLEKIDYPLFEPRQQGPDFLRRRAPMLASGSPQSLTPSSRHANRA